jgi:hypothetical protein
MIALTLYSRAGCHLCDEMKAVIERALRATTLRVTMEEIDIARDADLESRYGTEIPVLLVNGQKVAKYQVSDAVLRRILTERSTD